MSIETRHGKDRMHMAYEAVLATGVAATALIASTLPDAETIKATSNVPITIILGGVCCFLAWLLFRLSKEHGDRVERMAKEQDAKIADIVKAFNDLLMEWRSRPCGWTHRRASDEQEHIHARKE